MDNNRRDEPTNRANWSATKDDDRTSANSSEPTDPKDKKVSRWGNSSPKSIVSDEENWDDEGERKNDGSIAPLPQTEPIDDDSDVDFDDGTAATGTIEKQVGNDSGAASNVVAEHKEPPSATPQQQSVAAEQIPKSFDMFDEDEPNSIQQRNSEISLSKNDDQHTEIPDNPSNVTEGNTTPLYDEPAEKKENVQIDDRNDVGVNCDEQKDEKKWEPELPGIPGIDD